MHCLVLKLLSRTYIIISELNESKTIHWCLNAMRNWVHEECNWSFSFHLLHNSSESELRESCGAHKNGSISFGQSLEENNSNEFNATETNPWHTICSDFENVTNIPCFCDTLTGKYREECFNEDSEGFKFKLENEIWSLVVVAIFMMDIFRNLTVSFLYSWCI